MKISRNLAAGASAVALSSAVTAEANAGVMADIVTGSETVLTSLSTDITGSVAPIYIGIVVAVGGLLLLGRMMMRGLGR